MRNLTLYATSTADLHNARVTATTIDLDENVVYAASERQDPDGNVDVEIWNVGDDKVSVVRETVECISSDSCSM